MTDEVARALLKLARALATALNVPLPHVVFIARMMGQIQFGPHKLKAEGLLCAPLNLLPVPVPDADVDLLKARAEYRNDINLMRPHLRALCCDLVQLNRILLQYTAWYFFWAERDPDEELREQFRGMAEELEEDNRLRHEKVKAMIAKQLEIN